MLLFFFYLNSFDCEFGLFYHLNTKKNQYYSIYENKAEIGNWNG